MVFYLGKINFNIFREIYQLILPKKPIPIVLYIFKLFSYHRHKKVLTEHETFIHKSFTQFSPQIFFKFF